MSVRTRDWLKFGTLVAIAFGFGLAFASALRLPSRSDATESIAAAQAAAPRLPAPALRSTADLGDAVVSVAEHVKPAGVLLPSQPVERAQDQRLPPGFEDFFPNLRRRPQVEQGSGSGFIVSGDGYILTNNHVVAGADKVTVKLYDKREFTAKVVGTDPNTDVAVIKIDTRGLPTVQFGNSDSTRVGEWALAIGNPLGEAFAFTVTAGIVSAKGRLLQGLQQTRYAIQDFIQTDAAINPGNSGGPLVNIRGQVVGINSAIASDNGLSAGYGFAIPINLARTVMEQLVKTGHVERAVMGIGIVDADENDAAAVGLKQITGVVVKSYTDDNSPAKKAGVQLGDVIVALDGEPIDNTPQLQQKVAFKKPGDAVEITVLRQGGERKTLSVRLARAPSEADSEVASAGAKPKGEATKEEMLGVSVQPLTQDDAQNPRLKPVVDRGGGLVITDVAPDGPAYQRLRSADDPGGPDIIVAVNSVPTRTRAALRQALSKVKPGDVVTLQVLTRTGDSSDGWLGSVVRIRARWSSAPDRLAGLEIKQGEAAEAVIRLPVAAHCLDELGQRLVLLRLGDVEIVERDASDHVAVVGYLEALRPHRVGLGRQGHGATGVCQLQGGEVRVVRDLAEGRLGGAGHALAIGFRRLHAVPAGPPLHQRHLHRERELPRVEQMLIHEARLRRRRVEAEAGRHGGPDAARQLRLGHMPPRQHVLQRRIAHGGSVAQRFRDRARRVGIEIRQSGAHHHLQRRPGR